jgi:hypothetical protein
MLYEHKKRSGGRREFLYTATRMAFIDAPLARTTDDIHDANAGRTPGKLLAAVTGAFCLSLVKMLVIAALQL